VNTTASDIVRTALRNYHVAQTTDIGTRTE
jgi:hypothetical protein